MSVSRSLQSMSEGERQAWLTRFRPWVAELTKCDSRCKSDGLSRLFEGAFDILAPFPFCRAFINESRRVRDYGRRLNVLKRLAARVQAEAQAAGVDVPARTHVGRPTREEALAKQQAQQRELEERSKAPTLFSRVSESPVPVIVPAGSRRLSIAEVRWMLTPELQEKADMIRPLRSAFEESCTRAKQMAEDGRRAEEIEPYAKEAAKCLEAVEDIYSLIDDFLQERYVRLKEDPKYIKWAESVSRYDCKELRTLLRPSWDKLSVEEKEIFKRRVVERIKAEDPALAEARKESDERKQKVAAIVKYLRRTDKPNTLKRLAGMEQKLAELTDLIGSEAEVYMPLLVAAREDYEKNIRPADEAKRNKRK